MNATHLSVRNIDHHRRPRARPELTTAVGSEVGPSSSGAEAGEDEAEEAPLTGDPEPRRRGDALACIASSSLPPRPSPNNSIRGEAAQGGTPPRLLWPATAARDLLLLASTSSSCCGSDVIGGGGDVGIGEERARAGDWAGEGGG